MKIHLLPLTVALLSLPAVSAFAGGPNPDAKDMKGMSTMEMVSDAGVYVAAFGGANLAQGYANGRVDFTGPGGDFTYHGNNSNHVGAVGGIKVGYNFASIPVGGEFRLQPAVETEAFYVGTETNIHSNFGGSDDFDVKGHMNNAAFMLNGLVRLKTGTFFTPYVGAGIGTEYLTFTRPTVSEPSFDLNLHAEHNANAFAAAAQAIGGFDFEICKHWDLFTEYKYLVAIDPSLDFGNVNFGDSAYNTKLDPSNIGQHIVTVGVKYNF